MTNITMCSREIQYLEEKWLPNDPATDRVGPSKNIEHFGDFEVTAIKTNYSQIFAIFVYKVALQNQEKSIVPIVFHLVL